MSVANFHQNEKKSVSVYRMLLGTTESVFCSAVCSVRSYGNRVGCIICQWFVELPLGCARAFAACVLESTEGQTLQIVEEFEAAQAG